MSPAADISNTRRHYTAAQSTVPKGFYVRVYRGPTPSFPPSATAKFDVGYHTITRPESRQNQNWYESNSQHVPKSFSILKAPTNTPRSQLADTTAANRGYEPNPRSTTPSYSIYQSSSDTYIYEASISSKSDFFDHSEYEPSTTTLSPSSFFSPTISTDSLTTFKSPATTDSTLPDPSPQPMTPTTSRSSFGPVHIPGFSQAQSALRGIFRPQTPQDFQSSRAGNLHAAHAAPARPLPIPVPTANSRHNAAHFRDDLPISNQSTTPIRLDTVSVSSGSGDRSPSYSSPTTPISSTTSPTYAPSTASELEQFERDRIAKANAEYNAASSTSSYLTKRRESVLVSAPIVPNRTSSANGGPQQVYTSTPLRSSPEQQHAFISAEHTAEPSRATASSQAATPAEATNGNNQRRALPTAPYKYARSEGSDDNDQFVPRHSGARDQDTRQAASHRSPETRPPSTVPQFINEGTPRSRYVAASRTISPTAQAPAALESPGSALSRPPTGIDQDDDRGNDPRPAVQSYPAQAGATSQVRGGNMQRERGGTPIMSPPRVDGSAPPLALSPRDPRHAPPPASVASSNSPPSSPEQRRDQPRTASGESQGGDSGKYVPRQSNAGPNDRAITTARLSPDRISKASNLPSGTRGVHLSRTLPEQMAETPPLYHTAPPQHGNPPTAPPPRAATSIPASSSRAVSSQRPIARELPNPTAARNARGTERTPSDREQSTEAQLGPHSHQASSATASATRPTSPSPRAHLSQRSDRESRVTQGLAVDPSRVSPPASHTGLDRRASSTPVLRHDATPTRGVSASEYIRMPPAIYATRSADKVPRDAERQKEGLFSDSDSGTSTSNGSRRAMSHSKRSHEQDQRAPPVIYSSRNVDRSRSPIHREYPTAPSFENVIANAHNTAPSAPSQTSPGRGRNDPAPHATPKLFDSRAPSSLSTPAPAPDPSRSHHTEPRSSPPRAQSTLAHAPDPRSHSAPSTSPSGAQPRDIRDSPPRAGYMAQRRQFQGLSDDSADEAPRHSRANGANPQHIYSTHTPGRSSHYNGTPPDRLRHENGDQQRLLDGAGNHRVTTTTSSSSYGSPESRPAREQREGSFDSPGSDGNAKKYAGSTTTAEPAENTSGFHDADGARIPPSVPHRPHTEPRRRHSDGEADNDEPGTFHVQPHRRSSDGDQYVNPEKNALTLFRTVRWNETLVCPSPVSSSQRRKGWFNRRGDQLWMNNGAYKPSSTGEEYPPDLDGYPEPGEGWMSEEGVRIDMEHRLVPKTPRRSALKQTRA